MNAIKTETVTEADVGCIYGDKCPLHSENPPINAASRAAIEETMAIQRGEIPAKRFHSLAEMIEDLERDDPDDDD